MRNYCCAGRQRFAGNVASAYSPTMNQSNIWQFVLFPNAPKGAFPM
ncbi:MAG: hypothetical protein LBP87_11395 [Planctomycetaceae bacterium]|nr:hypothetical protein [Planctomycetaceae bacterium]